MDRRTFLKKSCGGMVVLSCPGLNMTEKNKKIRFGLITDLHFARKEKWETRYYEQSKQKLQDAITVFNDEKVDFLIELGDLKDQGTPPDKVQTLSFLDEIENTLQTFNGPVYHVLGNHDMDSISKQDYLAHTRNWNDTKGKTYYSFVRDKFKFIVLDGNFNEDSSDYNCGNFQWTKAMIPDDQKMWLQKELENSKYPVIIFVHQLLDAFSGISRDVCILNADEIVQILERSKNVIAVFQGHHHYGHYSFKDGIHYFTMKGMIEGSLPENNSFAVVEIDEDANIYLDGYFKCEDKIMRKS
ncbi:metallophosphoesterase [Parabacteroides bouchesdurhonensis]|uniref:metallophosphoesterase n=1 Tax=Parabacteroides bouchesdurhonensis TaxID=1936995 RepID=UPI000C81B859|nr:metallophosphoesterase [Parabacteroides bouchesdurhonensis]